MTLEKQVHELEVKMRKSEAVNKELLSLIKTNAESIQNLTTVCHKLQEQTIILKDMSENLNRNRK